MSSGRTSGHRPYHHGNLREALLQAAAVDLAAGGPLAVTLRGAARRAGVSQTAPYRHFPDKQTLLAAIAEQGFRALAHTTRRAAQRYRGNPLKCLQTAGVEYVRFALGNPARYRLMFGPSVADRGAYPALSAAAASAFRTLVEVVAQCHRADVMRPGDPADDALIAWSLVHGLASILMDSQVPRGAARARQLELARRAGEVLVKGLGKRRRERAARAKRPP